MLRIITKIPARIVSAQLLTWFPQNTRQKARSWSHHAPYSKLKKKERKKNLTSFFIDHFPSCSPTQWSRLKFLQGYIDDFCYVMITIGQNSWICEISGFRREIWELLSSGLRSM